METIKKSLYILLVAIVFIAVVLVVLVVAVPIWILVNIVTAIIDLCHGRCPRIQAPTFWHS